MSSLGTLGGDYSVANDVSGNGKVAGMSYTVANEQHLFVYEDGAIGHDGSEAGVSTLFLYYKDGTAGIVLSNGDDADVDSLMDELLAFADGREAPDPDETE